MTNEELKQKMEDLIMIARGRLTIAKNTYNELKHDVEDFKEFVDIYQPIYDGIGKDLPEDETFRRDLKELLDEAYAIIKAHTDK
ncbi:hypothetical protein [Selenomonas sp. AE3005]|uniref:hypothetical protein n=1 Tax=Selenomonas sp. AE3005 TaxID=1485543 RepID=UPI0004800E1D|nr:hypothetical protein [Selenomonas sp. AE3005]